MNDSRKFPVAIGNVTYLNGDPGQDQLASLANSYLGDVDIEAAIQTFSESLLAMGRPGNRANVIVEYGPRLTDWLMSGAFIKRVHWHGTHLSPKIRLPMFELHSFGRSGWCAEVCDGVLLHVRFSGNDNGLSSHEMACLLSESPSPNQALVDWLQAYLDEDRDFSVDDIANHIPEALREHLGYHFQYHQRIVSMWLGGNAGEALFCTYERDRNIERELF